MSISVPDASHAVFDRNGDCTLADAEDQLLECRRRIVDGVKLHDLLVYDKEDMIAFLGLTSVQLREVGMAMMELARG